jgi:hypothetical protein
LQFIGVNDLNLRDGHDEFAAPCAHMVHLPDDFVPQVLLSENTYKYIERNHDPYRPSSLRKNLGFGFSLMIQFGHGSAEAPAPHKTVYNRLYGGAGLACFAELAH